MSAAGLESLEHTDQLTHIWINDLDQRLERNNNPRAYRLLKAVLYALRIISKNHRRGWTGRTSARAHP